jgi:hypothetical protein
VHVTVPSTAFVTTFSPTALPHAAEAASRASGNTPPERHGKMIGFCRLHGQGLQAFVGVNVRSMQPPPYGEGPVVASATPAMPKLQPACVPTPAPAQLSASQLAI